MDVSWTTKGLTAYWLWLLLMFVGAKPYLSAQIAPDFSVTDLNSQQHQLYADYLDQGKYVVLEVFFATCAPCAGYAEALQDLYEEWGSGSGYVQFFQMSNKDWDTEVQLRAFIDRHGTTFPTIGPQGGSLEAVAPYEDGTFGSFTGTPLFIVISPDGTLAYNVRGNGVDGTIQEIRQTLTLAGALKPGERRFHIQGDVHYLDKPIPGVSIEAFKDDDLVAGGASDSVGQFLFNFVSIVDSAGLTLQASMDSTDFLNGVSTLDMVIILKHILGFEPFEVFRDFVAADVNKSGTISALDIAELRRLILGIKNSLPSGSWAVAPDLVAFQRSSRLPDSIPKIHLRISDQLADTISITYQGIKIGDMNGNANPNLNAEPAIRNNPPVALEVQDQTLRSGDVVTVQFNLGARRDLAGFQFALGIDPAFGELVDVTSSLPGWTPDCYTLGKHLGVSWISPTLASSTERILELTIRARRSSNISDILKLDETTTPEFYSSALETFPAVLTFIPEAIRIWPNPADDFVRIQTPFAEPGSRYELLDRFGRVVRTGILLSTYQQRISLSDIPAGSYTLKIWAGETGQVRVVPIIRN